MKQAARIVITDQNGIRLTISVDSTSPEQESSIANTAILFYKRLKFQLHKEDELDRTFYEEDNFNIAFEDDVETEDEDIDNITDDDGNEDYFFDDHQYK